jgi:hypothetical protein
MKREHRGRVVFALTSSDGKRAVTASGGNDVAVWDTASGALLARVVLPASAIPRAATFAHDGAIRVATTTGAVYTWRPDADSALAYVCSLIGRDITPAEWAEAFPERPFMHTC